MDPVSSWSITRCCRSEFRASSISSMISGNVVALLSGRTEKTYRDKVLVRRLLKAADQNHIPRGKQEVA